MLCRFNKSVMRAVHEEQVDEEEHQNEVKKAYYPKREGKEGIITSLTVWRKSLVISCKGFTVIDSEGKLVYRVDNYMGRPQEITLMDASGKSVLTMRRRTRRLGLVDSRCWNVYEGEVMGNVRPLCCVRKPVNILQGNPKVKVQAYVYRDEEVCNKKMKYDFAVEGSYAHRMCKVVDEGGTVVAEIKRKEANAKDVTFGIEIFHLIVHPALHPDFAMALVLLLDQMYS